MHGSYKTEAVVLRSLRLGEADRVLHLYTPSRGRVGAVAKGVRRTRSRFGGRLEPFLHEGSNQAVARCAPVPTVVSERVYPRLAKVPWIRS